MGEGRQMRSLLGRRSKRPFFFERLCFMNCLRESERGAGPLRTIGASAFTRVDLMKASTYTLTQQMEGLLTPPQFPLKIISTMKRTWSSRVS